MRPLAVTAGRMSIGVIPESQGTEDAAQFGMRETVVKASAELHERLERCLLTRRERAARTRPRRRWWWRRRGDERRPRPRRKARLEEEDARRRIAESYTRGRRLVRAGTFQHLLEHIGKGLSARHAREIGIGPGCLSYVGIVG